MSSTHTSAHKHSGRPLVIGLTGGIACGKSTAADCFATLGVPVIDADVVARELVQPGTPALEAIVIAFGENVLGPSGELDRQRMRERAFSDATQRRRLESILHPRIRAEIASWVDAVRHPYCVQCVPLLVETGQVSAVDRVVVVDVPTEVQIARAMARDGVSRKAVLDILCAQASRSQRLAIADDVIDNTGELKALCERVSTLHREYLAMAMSGNSQQQHLPAYEQK